jgi:hypothetical protein
MTQVVIISCICAVPGSSAEVAGGQRKIWSPRDIEHHRRIDGSPLGPEAIISGPASGASDGTGTSW